MSEKAGNTKGIEQQRMFLVVHEINQKLFEDIQWGIISCIKDNSTLPIYMLIDSYGGDVRVATQIYDLLKSLPCEVIGIVNGMCKSSALLVLAGCTERLSFAHSRFLFHKISTTFTISDMQDTYTKFETTIKQHQQLCTHIYDIYQTEFNFNVNQLKDISEKGEQYDYQPFAEEAQSLGIINRIIEKMPEY